MNQDTLQLDSQWLSFEDVKKLIGTGANISVSADAKSKDDKCRRYLDEKVNGSDELFYGINTEFAYLQNVAIDKDQVEQLQYNLLMSHACGLGEEVPAVIVKLMLALKIKSPSYSHSG